MFWSDPRDFVWMCAPRWDSDAVFSSLIGGGGVYAVTPSESRVVWGGFYEDRSLIWRSRWVTTTAIIECRQALVFPGDSHTAVLLRRVVAIEGRARVGVLLDPRAGFGAHKMGYLTATHGVWTARTAGVHLRWSGGAEAKPAAEGGLALHIEVEAGAYHDLVLELRIEPVPATRSKRRRRGRRPRLGGRPPSPTGRHPRRLRGRHSYAVLRGLTGAGGMVAAATMSLPERSDAGRNYDYRYVWIRDQCYTGQAIAADGPHRLLDDAVAFVAGRILTDGAELKPAYTVTGSPVPDEQSCRILTATRAVRTRSATGSTDSSNSTRWAKRSCSSPPRQATTTWTSSTGGRPSRGPGHRMRWTDADAGIWELDNRHWAHSRLMCVAGLRAIAGAGAAGLRPPLETLADAIMADVASDSLHPTGRWQRAPHDDRVDAALLLPHPRCCPRDDPRSLATLEAVRTDLASTDTYTASATTADPGRRRRRVRALRVPHGPRRPSTRADDRRHRLV